MGRTKTLQADEVRNLSLGVPVNADELKLFKALAKKHQRSLASLTRYLLYKELCRVNGIPGAEDVSL